VGAWDLEGKGQKTSENHDMKSEMEELRHKVNKLTPTTNLIVHDSILNISNQTAEQICILGIGEESLNHPLLCQWGELQEDVF